MRAVGPLLWHGGYNSERAAVNGAAYSAGVRKRNQNIGELWLQEMNAMVYLK
jgi:hypothetical protein